MIEARGRRRTLVHAYDIYSFFYVSTVARLERKAVRQGLARAGIQPGERVLEVAVGPGVVHEQLLTRVRREGFLAGVDLAAGMLRAARRRIPGARLARADARALPFASENFDLVWASYFLDLIPTAELVPVLKEFLRVLRPGGRLLLVNFSKCGERLTAWERLYQMTPAALVPWLFAGCRPIEAAPFAEEAGFVEVEREYLAAGFNSEIITAKKGSHR